MSVPLPPSVYVSRLRRAFFLRVHPDRFRSHDNSIRQKQAKLMQALNDRMSWSDFISYNYGGSTTTSVLSRDQQGGQLFEYHLEHRDGSLLNQKIQLNDSVENILDSMAKALRRSGAATLPKPPPQKSLNDSNTAEMNSNNQNRRNSAQNTTGFRQRQPHVQWAKETPSQGVDHQFDINTTKGRDLLAFCHSLDRQQVEDRRSSRMDANAAAMIGRRLYQFQSIDGTPLNWSSASFATIMKKLIELHEEHSLKFFVGSFYPLRLVFTNDDFHESLDLYGGNLHLHPGYTPIQWLDILRKVTPEKLDVLQENRQRLEEANRKIQSVLGIRVKKGYSCSSKSYYNFLINFAANLRPVAQQEGLATTSSSIALEPIQITVEAADACRFRTKVTSEGHIRVGAGMSVDTILSGLAKHSTEARRRMEQERQERQISDQHAQQVQRELGLTRKVYKAGTFHISHEEFQHCLRRLVNLEQGIKEHLKMSLGGNSLGIVASGFVRLGDDGSVVIPHDWSVEASM